VRVVVRAFSPLHSQVKVAGAGSLVRPLLVIRIKCTEWFPRPNLIPQAQRSSTIHSPSIPVPLQPGVVYLDTQLSKMLEKQDELLEGQRRQAADIADLKDHLERLTGVVSETNSRVMGLKEQIVPPLHNAVHDTAEATIQSVAHFSGEKIVDKTIQDALPALSVAVAEVGPNPKLWTLNPKPLILTP